MLTGLAPALARALARPSLNHRRFYTEAAVLVQPADCTRLMRALVRLRSVNFSLYLKDSDTTLERERPRLGRLGYVCRRTTVRRRQSLTAEHCPLQAAAWSFSLCATQGLAALRGGRGRGGRRRLLLMVLPADHTQPQPRRSALAGVRPVPRAHRRMVRVPPVPARMRRPHVV